MSGFAVWVDGAGIGLLAGLGLLLVLARLPWRRRPQLDDRLAPYVRDLTPRSSLLAPVPAGSGPLALVERFLAPVMADATGWVERASGGPLSVRRRLDRLDGSLTVEQFRSEQVVWGVVGAAAGGGCGLLLVGARGGSAVPALGLVVVVAVLAVLGRDWLLSVAVRRREQRMLAEFPTVAELVALSIGAGEGVPGALERVSRVCSGELAAELSRAMADVRAGATLTDALDALGARTGVTSLARFVEGIVIALQRGTPLADVIRAQAQDVREMSRRRLIESGARREVAMMVPVVFLVLPVTVLFVVYPGLALLDLKL